MGSSRARVRGREPGKTRRTRADWGSISRQQIIEVATKVVRNGGYEGLTIRSLAAELGVSPMAFYSHVRSKEELLDEVVDVLLGEVWLPSAPEENWRAWITEAADILRRFLVTQPAGLHVYLRHPVISASAITRMGAMIRILRSAGLSSSKARRAYGAIHTYTIGFAAVEASRARVLRPLENVTQLTRQLSSFTTSTQFFAGLDYLLDGILLDCRRGNAARA